ncbi:MAG: Gfo/Idh/MocA family oxidoreductase [Planctomycetes bacterium]|nr:Gfo/Idh/MocA family oxidoreductase [Planctomycetota bacterium]
MVNGRWSMCSRITDHPLTINHQPLTSMKEAVMSKRRLRIGVIGCGGIFRGQHLPYYQKSDLAEVLAVADVDKARAKEVAEKLKAPFHSDNPNDILKRDDLDVVDISTHPENHCALTVAATAAGKHVLIEKPMCISVAEADDMIAAAEKAKVKLAVAYPLPFDPAFQRVKDLIDKKAIGDLVSLRFTSMSFFNAPQHPWLFRKEKSGGMFVENTIHWINAFLWWGGPVEEVSAFTKTVPCHAAYQPVDGAIESEIVAILRFQKGAIGAMTQSWSARLGSFEAGIVGSEGGINFTHTKFTIKAKGSDKVEEIERSKTAGADAKARCLEHFLRCVLDDETPCTSGEVGRADVEVAEAAYIAAAEKRVVELPL